MRLRDHLPSLFQNWLTRPEWDRPLSEHRATCDNCLQARGATAIYKPSLKCCTFFPFQANFAVGAVLQSELPGRAWIEALLQPQSTESSEPSSSNMAEMAAKLSSNLPYLGSANRTALAEAVVVPLGIGPSIVYQRRFKRLQPEGYGNDESLLCPHYMKASGQCAIWRQRPSPCISFYCESSFGLAGVEFWTRFEKWLSSAELTLAQEALLRLGFTEPEIDASKRFLPRYGDPDPYAPTGEKLRLIEQKSWLEFGRDKASFYRRCYETIRGLSSDEFREILGQEGLQIEDEILRRLTELRT